MPRDEELSRKLKSLLGATHLLESGEDKESYRVDGLVPRWVIFPQNREDASKILQLGLQETLSLIPWGSGTKMGLGNIPKSADLIVATKNLNRVVDQDLENLTITLEAGVRLADIQGQLRQKGKGYLIPLDPPFTEGATLGGIIATNSSGPKRLLYGTARDIILGMKVISIDGHIISCGGKTVKNVSGYDMDKLYIGSLGTLGLIVEATLRLLPLPDQERTLLTLFPEAKSACQVTQEILQSQLLPSSLEIFNTRAMKGIPGDPVPEEDGYGLLIGIEGVEKAVQRQAAELRSLCDRYNPLRSVILEGNTQMNVWQAERDTALRMIRQFPATVILKINVPLSGIDMILAWAEGAARQEKFSYALFGHAGNGILRLAVLLAQLPSEEDRLVSLIRQVSARAVEMGGNLIIEFAPPAFKPRVKVWGHEKRDVAVFRQLKSRVDPSFLFNPGRFVGGI